MLQIKLRAWDEENKIMDYDFESSSEVLDKYFLVIEDGRFSIGNERNNGDYYELEIMLYTGFCDKNGKQIFDNDILECNGVKYQLVREKGKAYELRNEEHDQMFFLFNVHKTVVVAGNTYENPK